MRRSLLLFVVLLFIGFNSYAQFAEKLKEIEVHGSFQFDGAYYVADSAIDFTEQDDIRGKPFRFNGFGKITMQLGGFSAGIRYEAYLPPLIGFDEQLEGQGFPNIWATYTDEKFTFTVGSFYEQFGNGLTLRAYDEWMLGYDNAINGARVTFEPVKGLMFKGIFGVQRFFWYKWPEDPRGIIKGIDGELDFNRVFQSMENSKLRLMIGLSAVSKYQIDSDPYIKYPENVSNVGGRINVGIGKFNLASEYAWKVNDPSEINDFIYKDGQAFMLSLTYSTRGFGFFGMFKRYDNVSNKSDRFVTSNALDVSFLPPNTEMHTYMLTAMYPYATQPNGEIGFQFQVNYKVPKKTKLGGKYGMGISLNYSQVNNIQRNPVNDTTPVTDLYWESYTDGWKSPFFTFGNPIFWRDFTVEIDKKINKDLKAKLTYMNQTYNIAVIEGHPEDGPIVYANIAVLDMTYKFNSNNALHWEIQGLWTQQDDGDWAAVLLEYTISPHWFFAITDQYNYGNPEVDRRNHYINGSFGYTVRTTRLSIGGGRVREGIVCVGGVCRAVPASNGVTFAISTSF